MGEQIKSSLLIKTLLQEVYSYFSFHLPTFQLFISTKKLWRHISFSSACFCHYRKHPNNDNKICQLRSSSCFQQRVHDWFCVLRHNSDLLKPEWTLLLFNFNYIRDLTNRRRLFSIPVAASFSQQARTLKTNLLGLIWIISKYYFKTSTICFLFTCIYRFKIW